jgi:hypothetical protein
MAAEYTGQRDLYVIDKPAELARSIVVFASGTDFRCSRNSWMPVCLLVTLWAVKQPPGASFGHSATK